MSQIDYLDKYDKEFVNLMLEINNRIENFSKLDKLKINSWIKSLCLPTNNIPWKKNRNLYTLKLLDNILNSRLENPFTKFADVGENLPMLDPILIKSQLSNKIYMLINNINSDYQIQNFIEANMTKNNNNKKNNEIKLNLLNKNRPIYRAKTPSASNTKRIGYNYNNNFVNDKNENKKLNRENIGIGYDNKRYRENNNSEDFYKGDQLLNKNYFDFDKKLSNESGYYKKTKLNPVIEKKKLQSIIEELENECDTKNQIINQQELDIQQLKNRISQLEKRIQIVFKK